MRALPVTVTCASGRISRGHNVLNCTDRTHCFRWVQLWMVRTFSCSVTVVFRSKTKNWNGKPSRRLARWTTHAISLAAVKRGWAVACVFAKIFNIEYISVSHGGSRRSCLGAKRVWGLWPQRGYMGQSPRWASFSPAILKLVVLVPYLRYKFQIFSQSRYFDSFSPHNKS